jgi:hypothetical protein
LKIEHESNHSISQSSPAKPRKKFYYTYELMSFDDGRAHCKSYAMDLITFSSAEEMRNILHVKNSNMKFWVGITDRAEQGVFKNYNNKEVDMTYILEWQKDEPNNLGGNERCVELDGWEFNDVECDSYVNVACEMKF